MALPTFDTKDKIPAGFEEEYEERDGKWVPIDHSAKLHKALETERAAREAAEAVAKKAAKEAADLKTRKDASAAGMTEEELKKIYDRIEASLREEYEPFKVDAEKLKSEVRALKLDLKVKELFKSGDALPTKIDDFWKLHGDEFDLTADGKPMVKDEPGKDVARHVQGILKTRPEWVQGTKASGGGATPFTSTTHGRGLSPGGLTFEDMLKNPSAAIAVANE
jgi:hypothetical protein